MARRETNQAPPGFLNSLIVLLVSTGLALFLLWAASRIQGVTPFDQLAPWLSSSYSAVWGVILSGTGLSLAVIKALLRKDQPTFNYLLAILATTAVLLVAIVLLTYLFKPRVKPLSLPPIGVIGPLKYIDSCTFTSSSEQQFAISEYSTGFFVACKDMKPGSKALVHVRGTQLAPQNEGLNPRRPIDDGDMQFAILTMGQTKQKSFLYDRQPPPITLDDTFQGTFGIYVCVAEQARSIVVG
jgi:hypothetical protein